MEKILFFSQSMTVSRHVFPAMMSVSAAFQLKPRGKSGKQKYTITNTKTGKQVHFGLKGYQDFTEHHDTKRKRMYLKRHAKDSKSLKKAGFWARSLLWNKPTLKGAIRNVEKRHRIRIHHKMRV